MTPRTLSLFNAPSTQDGETLVNDNPPIYIQDGPPRTASISNSDLLKAFSQTLGDIPLAPAALETLCGLRSGSSRDWFRRNQIPPPRIVALVAHLNSFGSKYDIATVAFVMACSPDPDNHQVAKFFFEEFRK